MQPSPKPLVPHKMGMRTSARRLPPRAVRGVGPMATPDYAWLREPGPGRMGSLRMVGTAIRRGYLDSGDPELGARRVALLAALVELAIDDPTATDDERLEAIRIIGWTQGTGPLCRTLRSR